MESISDVSISEINDHDGNSNWRASVLEKNRADISHIIVIVERLQDELREVYRLAPTGATPSAD